MWVESGWLSEMRPKSSPILMLYLLHRQTPLVKKKHCNFLQEIYFSDISFVIFRYQFCRAN